MVGLFSRKNKPLNEDETDAAVRKQGGQEVLSSPAAVQFIVGVGQSVGIERSHNEDTVFTLSTLLHGNNKPLSLGIFMVADGMGGHLSGELASGMAVQAASTYLIEHVTKPLLNTSGNSAEVEWLEVLENAVDKAQKSVLTQVPGGGTTLTIALVVNEVLFFAHVGDSRLYLMQEDGSLQICTQDHSLVKRLVALGQISPAEAAVHPQRNVLYRALGQTEAFKPDLGSLAIGAGKRLMLCSDGLWGLVAQERLGEIIKAYPNPVEACQALVEAANQAGGPDNISVILVQID